MGVRKFFAYMYDTVLKTLRIGDTSGSNYSSFTEKGILRNVGEALQWDDIMGHRVAGTGLLTPAVTTIIGNLKLPSFARTGTDEEFWNFEIQHNTKLNSMADIHFHGVPNISSNGNIKMDIEVWKMHNGDPLSAVGDKYSVTKALTTANNAINCVCEFTDALDLTNLVVGDLIMVRLTRDNTVANNATGVMGSYQMGIHRQIDGFGSDERWVKTV